MVLTSMDNLDLFCPEVVWVSWHWAMRVVLVGHGLGFVVLLQDLGVNVSIVYRLVWVRGCPSSVPQLGKDLCLEGLQPLISDESVIDLRTGLLAEPWQGYQD